MPSDTAFLVTVETPLKSTERVFQRRDHAPRNPRRVAFVSVRFTAQRLPSRLSSRELSPRGLLTARLLASLCFGKNVLLLVNAFIVFGLRYDTTF